MKLGVCNMDIVWRVRQWTDATPCLEKATRWDMDVGAALCPKHWAAMQDRAYLEAELGRKWRAFDPEFAGR